MPIFKYKVLKKDGTQYSDVITANSQEDAIKQLKERGSYVLQIKQKSSSSELKLGGKIGSKELAIFCKQLSAMLDSGMPIINSMEIMMTQTVNKKMRETSGKIYEDLQKGTMFSETLATHKDVFPELMISMIEAAESSGTIEDILRKLAFNYDKETKVRQKIKSATMYPMVLGFAAIVMVIFMLMFVLPQFIEMFDSAGAELPGITKFVIGISDSIRTFWYVYIILIVGFVVTTKLYLATPQGRWNFDKFKFKLPGVERYVTMLITTRFTRTLATLIFSGVPLINALESTSKVLGNVIAKDRVQDVQKEVQRGMELSDSVKATEIFPPMVDNMIRIGEESGTLDDILEKTADYFDGELDAAVTNMTALFEPVLLVFMGIILGFIVIAMALPMFEVMKAVK